MTVQDISFSGARENIEYDQRLLDSAEEGSLDETLRFWEAEDFCVVLGRISKDSPEVRMEDASRDGIEITRRMSGGGTVLQGPGCLNYSLILSLEKNSVLRDIRNSYGFIIGRICGSFNKIGVDAKFEPLSDMALGGRKFSGNAQWRRKKYILHHGTILYNFPFEAVEKYLKMPPAEPPYRKGRSHSDFLTNLKLDASEIKKVIVDALGTDTIVPVGTMVSVPNQEGSPCTRI